MQNPGTSSFLTGVFSSQEEKKIGTGATSRRTIQKAYWFCEEQEDGSFEAQPINANNIPSGPKKTVSREDFLNYFTPEPEMYYTVVSPTIRAVEKALAKGDRHRGNKEYYSAEMEYDSVLQVDEENIRANFGLGITYLARGNTDKATDVFNRLVKLEAAFELRHKHLFNEFGIRLRKNNMFDHASAYYSRAMQLTAEDEHLFYNLARACLGQGNHGETVNCLCRALELNGRLEPAVRFLFWLYKHGKVPEAKKTEVETLLKSLTDSLTLDDIPAPEHLADDEEPDA